MDPKLLNRVKQFCLKCFIDTSADLRLQYNCHTTCDCIHVLFYQANIIPQILFEINLKLQTKYTYIIDSASQAQ